MNCHVCGADDIAEAGEVEYYAGYGWKVYDCLACSCRFTGHDDSIYEWLHSQAGSSYGLYRELADKCKRLYDAGDLARLRHELCATTKYRFVIEAIERYPKGARILEVGCSRGYLTSYFILAGYNVTGTDISAEAVAGAKEAFGDFFMTADSPAVADGAPYDVIYHVGTIGCVGDPLSFTRHLLGMLKSGGELIFNAPNANSCWLKEQLWIDAAPPPDLVTLFRPGFWSRQFAGAAAVEEEIEPCSPERSFEIGVSKLFGRKWQRPEPLPLETSLNDFKAARRGDSVVRDKLWRLLERGAIKAGRLTRTLALAPTQPSPFGLLVRMTKV